MQEQRPSEHTPGTAIPMPPATPQTAPGGTATPGTPSTAPGTESAAGTANTTGTAAGTAPGTGAGTAEGGIWDQAQAEQLRQRWHEMQTRFVEDPEATVAEARRLLDEAVDSLAANVHEREEELARAGARGADSTEGRRDTVLQYHRLLDRLLTV